MTGRALPYLAACLCLARALPVMAQDSTSWRASGSYGFEAFTEDRSPWHAASLNLTRKTPRLTVVGAVDSWHRFDITDVAAVADVYTVLRRGTYVNWRLHWGPGAEVVANTDAGIELYHEPGKGIELSAGYRYAAYTNSNVDLANASVARYTGDWYLRARGTLAFQGGATGFALGLLGRRTFATSDDLAELQGGFGQEIVTLGPGAIDLAPTAFVAGRWQKRFGARWGGSIGASWNRQEGIPNRAGLTFGVFTIL